MKLDEPVQRGNRLDLFAVFELGIGFFKLRLLRQRRSSGTAFEFFKQ